MKYALIGVIIDFIQVFGFTISSDFGWGSDYEIVSGFLQGAIQLINWNIFQAFFWITLVVIVIAFIVAYIVGYSFAVSDFKRLWPIKFMRTVTNALLTILFIPFLTILLVPLKSDDSIILRNYPSVPIWGPETLSMGLLSIVVIIVFIPFCLLMSLLNFEFSANTRDIMARHGAHLDFIYMILKTVIVLVTNLTPVDGSSITVRIAIMALATLFVSLFVIVYVPYYAIWMNVLRAGLFFSLMGAVTSVAINVFGRQPFGGLASGMTLLIHVGISILYGLIGAFLMKIRLSRLLKRENLYSYISSRAATTSKKSNSSQAEERRRVSASSVALKPLRAGSTTASSIRSSPKPQRTTKTSAVASADRSGVFGSIWRTLSAYHISVNTVIRTLFLQVDSSSDDLVHLANTVFQRAIEKNQHASQYLCIHYANFLLSFKLDWVAALAQIRKATYKKVGFFQRWLCYSVNKRIDREKRAHRLGTNASVELMKYVEFQHGIQNARRHHLSNLRYLRNFWETLLHDEGDKQLLKMSRAQMNASNSQARALYSFSRLLSNFPQSPLLWRSYGAFLSDCGESEEGDAAFQTADMIEEKVSTAKHRPMMTEGDAMATIPSLSGIPEVPEEDEEENHSQRSVGFEMASQHSRALTGSSSGSSVMTSRLFGNMRARSGTHRLHSRFVQAVCTMLLVFIGNYVTSGFLIGVEDEALTSNWDVIVCRMDTILGTVAVEELALNYLINDTIGLDAVSWKLIPDGVDGHAKLALSYFDDLKTRVNNLFGKSRTFGYGVAKVWDTADATLDTFPDQKTIKAGLKTTIDSWLRSLIQSIDIVQKTTMTGTELWETSDLPYGLVNGISGLALAEASNTLMIIVLSILGACILLAVVVSFVNIRPTLKEVHLDEHLCHAMLTLIPLTDIEPIVKIIHKQEAELTQQLLESGVDSDDEQKDSIKQVTSELPRVEVSHRKHRQWAKTSKSLANTEVRLHHMATRHAKKCKEMRHLAYKYAIGMCLVLVLLLGQAIEIILTLNSDVAVSKLINYSAERIDKVGDTFALAHFLPKEIRDIFDGKWGQNVLKGLAKKTRQLTEYHNYATFGDTANDNITIAYSYIQDHQAALFKVFDPLIYTYSDELKKLAASNLTTLTYADPSFNVLHALWNNPGTLKLPLEAANKQYYDQIIADNQTLRTNGAVWFAGEIIALILAYVFAVKPIVSELEEKSDSIERMLKMVPGRVLGRIPVIADYLKDKVAFLDRVKEKAAQESTSDDLDEAWSSMFVEESEDGYIVLNKGGEIIHSNSAANKLFGAVSSKDTLHHEKVEALVTPAYRHALVVAMKAAEKYPGKGEHCSVMGVLRGSGETFLADVKVTCVNLGRRGLIFGGRDTLLILVWTKATETTRTTQLFASTVSTSVAAQKLHREEPGVLNRGAPAIVCSLSGQVVEANEQAITLLKATDDITKRKFTELVHDSSITRADALLREAVVSTSKRCCRRITLQSGVVVKVQAVAARYNSVDDLKVIVMSMEDLSDIIAIEKSIRYHEQLERTLMATLPVGIVSVSNHEIAMVNDEAISMLGYTAEGINGQPISCLFQNANDWQTVKVSTDWRRVTIKKQDGGSAVLLSRAMTVGDVEDNVGMALTLLFLLNKKDSLGIGGDPVTPAPSAVSHTDVFV